MTNHKLEKIPENTTQIPEYPNLYFYNINHLTSAIIFSHNNKEKLEENGTLTKQLESLNNLAKNNKLIALISPDFVKHSLYFQLYNKSTLEYDFNGGIILHGYEETFSVEINPQNKPHWSIHTWHHNNQK